MIKATVSFIKICVFCIVILILGNWFKVGDKTLSDQIKIEMAHAEKSQLAGKMKNWANEFSEEIQALYKKKVSQK